MCILFDQNVQYSLSQTRAHLHVNGTTASHYVCMLESSAHDHDGIMQAALGFVDKLQNKPQTSTDTVLDAHRQATVAAGNDLWC